ncbi:MAG TPA: hypothetical protein DDY13_04060 [Cytophagales bacterium]|nr:hypothetical protein [Cytophagales bacterium]
MKEGQIIPTQEIGPQKVEATHKLMVEEYLLREIFLRLKTSITEGREIMKIQQLTEDLRLQELTR